MAAHRHLHLRVRDLPVHLDQTVFDASRDIRLTESLMHRMRGTSGITRRVAASSGLSRQETCGQQARGLKLGEVDVDLLPARSGAPTQVTVPRALPR
jgi:hypothetical protein